jgi:hypothetical protein
MAEVLTTNDWIKNMCTYIHTYMYVYIYTHTMVYYSAIKKTEIMLFKKNGWN